MNVINLKKKYKTHIRTDWKANRYVIDSFSTKDANKVLSVLDAYKSKKSIKEVAIIKYEGIPIFVTIKYSEFIELLHVLNDIFLKKEDYETCAKVQSIITYFKAP